MAENWIRQYESFSKKDFEPTKISEADEPKFRSWLQQTKLFNSIKQEIAQENKLPVESLDNNRIAEMLLSSKDYDYRGAWKAGVKEVISPYDNKPHWPSSANGKMLKSPKHETAWKEFFMQEYKKDPDELGLSTISQAKEWSISRSKKNTIKNQRQVNRPMLMEERLK